MKLLLAADMPDWQSRDASRRDQYFRTNLARALKILVSHIENCGSNGGAYQIDGGGSLHFKLQPSPITKPENEEAA